ncbi:MAG: HlyD family type I secretion periplasmic adaptor subunit [Pseudomonadota bacterium]|nr:HlyD family type I secretion periplasmic adaptor subunit [Pseudomonadota bacterium]
MFRKKALDRRTDRREVSLAIVREYQSEIAALREQPYPRGAGMTIHILSAFLAVGIGFMYVSRIDRSVSSSSGAIAPVNPPIVYQALDPSIIRTLDVKEGQRVGKGQVLATLDPTFATATVNQLRAQIDGLRIQIARDTALIAQAPLNYPAPSSDQIGRYQRENLEYYRQQMAQYKAGMDSYDQKIATLRATIEKYKVEETRYASEADVTQQIEQMRVKLEQHGTGSMLNLLTSTQAKIETQRSADYARNSRIEAEHTLASTQADQKSSQEQFKATVSADLMTARNSLEAALPQLDAALKHQELVRWTAPEDCIILTIAPNMSIGSVVSQGTTVITLMPVRNPIEAMVQISSSNIGFVRPGDAATLKVDAFHASEYGSFDGTVKWVGDNAYSQLNGQPVSPYYNVEISIDRNKLVNVPPTAALLPGMTLTADIKVGSRSIWDYVMGGLMRGIGESMREP